MSRRSLPCETVATHPPRVVPGEITRLDEVISTYHLKGPFLARQNMEFLLVITVKFC